MVGRKIEERTLPPGRLGSAMAGSRGDHPPTQDPRPPARDRNQKVEVEVHAPGGAVARAPNGAVVRVHSRRHQPEGLRGTAGHVLLAWVEGRPREPLGRGMHAG